MEGETGPAGEAGSAGSGDGGGADDGSSDCTPPGFEDSPTICPGGQYCSDSTLAVCENGCLSNANCASDQVCELPDGESVGACANVQAAVPESEFCEKFVVCSGADAAACNMFFAGTSSECHQCILEENCSDINAFEGECDAECGF